MMRFGRQILMMGALLLVAPLSACLPDQKDPGAVSDAGQLSGSFYASALSNTAIQLQNAVMGDPAYFSMTGAVDLDLAALGVTTASNGVNFRSFVCPADLAAGETTATRVSQITWLDGRNATTGEFSIKGVGQSSGNIVAALNTRMSNDQVGTFNGTTVQLSNGTTFTIPASCASIINIPVGAPVIAFNVDRPATPQTALRRTEYRTSACPPGANGAATRGTRVESRVVTHNPDGNVVTGPWTYANMGHCIADVDVTTGLREFFDDASSASLSLGFQADATLANLLNDQLKMDCVRINVKKTQKATGDHVSQEDTKQIDTCTQVSTQATPTVTESDRDNASDWRSISCTGTGAGSGSARAFGVDGTYTAGTWSGTGTVSRVRDNRYVVGSTAASAQGGKEKWRGEDLNCSRTDTFYGDCNNIPGRPLTGDRVSHQKWLHKEITDLASDTGSWFNPMGWGVQEYRGGYAIYLNPDYFTGGSLTLNNGVRASRQSTVSGWKEPREALKAKDAVGHDWQNVTAECAWGTRKMWVECPDWGGQPSSGAPYYGEAFGMAILPGAHGPHRVETGKSRQVYDELRGRNIWPAYVLTRWYENQVGPDDDNWVEIAGPGGDNENHNNMVNIKSWHAGNFAPTGASFSGPAYQKTLLNKDGVLMGARPYFENGQWVVRDTGALAEPIGCVYGQRSNRTIRATWNNGTFDNTEEVVEYRVYTFLGTDPNSGWWSNVEYYYDTIWSTPEYTLGFPGPAPRVGPYGAPQDQVGFSGWDPTPEDPCAVDPGSCSNGTNGGTAAGDASGPG